MMTDQQGRQIERLQIQITKKDRFAPLYDRNWQEEGKDPEKEGILALVRAAAAQGVSKIRLTGGEPLEREDLEEVIGEIAKIQGIKEITMRTGARGLDARAEGLKKAGLTAVSVCLDTFFEEKYIYMTGGGKIDQAMDGLEAAVKWEMKPVRVETVIMEGFNEDEILSFGQLVLNEPIDVVFVQRKWDRQEEAPVLSQGKQLRFMQTEEVKKKFKGLFGLKTVSSPAQFYQWSQAKGRVGFVDPDIACREGIGGTLLLTGEGRLREAFSEKPGVPVLEELERADENALAGILRRAFGEK